MHAFEDSTVKVLDEAEIQETTDPEHFVPTEDFATASMKKEQSHDEVADPLLHSAQDKAMISETDATGGVWNSPTTNINEFLQLTKWIEFPDFIPPKEKRMFLELFSGPRHPLSSYIHSLGVKVLKPFDILLDPQLNILDDQCYFSILRLVASREVGTVVAAPPCTEYSLLKLKQPGPLPCRLPDRLEEPLYNTADCHRRFYESREILHRTSVVLHIQHIHGGYSGLEQPLHAMSWNEPFILEARQDFLTESAIFSHCMVLDEPENALNKHWLFVTNINNFHQAELQCTCDIQHASFAGIKTNNGDYESKLTAEYPKRLVQHISNFLRLEPSSAVQDEFLHWDVVRSSLPRSPPAKFHHIPDGGGLVSSALWPLPFKKDVFKSLRKQLEELAFSFGLPTLIPLHIQQKCMNSPFSPEVMEATEAAFRSFLQDSDIDFDIPTGQPFRLHVLRRLALLMEDPDADLIPNLISGVDLGIDFPIPSSNTWPARDTSNPSDIHDFGVQDFLRKLEISRCRRRDIGKACSTGNSRWFCG